MLQGRRRAGPLLSAGRGPGRRSPVTAFLTTLSKIGDFAALYRLAAEALSGTDVPWAALVAVVTLGNLAAFFQQDVERLLVYSTM
ncbi:proton-conducting transporter membrane subunit [Streptomyces canus]|uniref:proton-conducting transporter transmembrane domain-containing protein n=1 Tax=Streptomyces canus TaxID=58343 RepID=UPI0036E1BA4D